MRNWPEQQHAQRGIARLLCFGWGGGDGSVGPAYLQAALQHLTRCNGPVLECGSGLTTIALGIMARARGVDVWSLEHDAGWHQRTTAALQARGLINVHLVHTPLCDYDGFQWYAAPLEEMPRDFALVICDGPPRATSGGRYGLLPIMRPHLRSDATILLDDAHRPGEQAVMSRWRRESPLTTELRNDPPKQYAVLSRGG